MLFSPVGRKLLSGHLAGGRTSLCTGDASWLWKKLSLGELPSVLWEGW